MNKLLRYLMLLIVVQKKINAEFSLNNEAWFDYNPLYLEYIITEGMQTQYPRQLEIVLSMKTVAGTLIYSIDKDNMQFVVNVYAKTNMYESPEIEVKYGGTAKMRYKLRDICGCKWTCLYDKLKLTFQWGKDFSVKCNNGKIYRKSAPKHHKVEADEYPVVPFNLYNKTTAAVLWMVNFPSKYGVKSNYNRIRGCIFSVKYNNKEIDMVPYGKFKKGKCGRSCERFPNVCNGGRCVETYNYLPKCDCSTTLMNGEFCNKSVSKVDKMYNDKINIKNIKLSWRSQHESKTLIKMEGRNTVIEVYILNMVLHLKLNIQETEFDMKLPKINYMKKDHILFMGIINKSLYIEFPEQNYKCAPCINVNQHSFTFTRSVIYGSAEFIDVAYRKEHDFRWQNPFLRHKYKVLNKTTTSAVSTTITVNVSNVDNYKYGTFTVQFESIVQYISKIQKNQYIFIGLLIIVLIFVIGSSCIGIIVYLKSNNENVKSAEESESEPFFVEKVADSLKSYVMHDV